MPWLNPSSPVTNEFFVKIGDSWFPSCVVHRGPGDLDFIITVNNFDKPNSFHDSLREASNMLTYKLVSSIADVSAGDVTFKCNSEGWRYDNLKCKPTGSRYRNLTCRFILGGELVDGADVQELRCTKDFGALLSQDSGKVFKTDQFFVRINDAWFSSHTVRRGHGGLDFIITVNASADHLSVVGDRYFADDEGDCYGMLPILQYKPVKH